MGVIADAALAAGGEVVGVIPQKLVEWEVAHPRPDRASRRRLHA
jgi:predicted Rossmann-fold nucleotide-binding protein